jgi:mono/diheme cytochrome c family protein
MKKVHQKQNWSSRHLFYLLAVFAFLFLWLNCSETSSTAAKSPVEEGKEWFVSYCVICHGEKADGMGAMADSLQVHPLDLTRIAQRRGGNFPDEQIAKIIAGKENVPGHSNAEMPDWLETFKKSENISDEKVLMEKINHIVAYLKTLQQQ